MKAVILLALLAFTVADDLGLDVSSNQGTVDWESVAADGYTFAIIRTTVKDGSMDSKFSKNAEGAMNAGLSIGGYHFSYDLSTDDAEASAQNLIDKLPSGYEDMPIFLDLEWDKQGQLSKDEVTEIALAFINYMQDYGFQVHIYSNKDWYKNHYNPSEFESAGCAFWIASYGPDDGEMHEKYKPNIGEAMWQYTSKGSVSGISGDVDLDVMY